MSGHCRVRSYRRVRGSLELPVVEAMLRSSMKMSKLGTAVAIAVVAWVLPGLTGFAGSGVEQIYVKQDVQSDEALVYVTGSRLPQRVRVWETGAATAWPVRIIRQHEIEINHTGQRGTGDIFATEPSARIIGH